MLDKHLESDTRGYVNVSSTPAARRRGSDMGRALRSVDLTPSVIALSQRATAWPRLGTRRGPAQVRSDAYLRRGELRQP